MSSKSVVVSRRFWLACGVVYALGAVTYAMTLELTSGWQATETFSRAVIDYALKGAWSLLIASAVFRLARHRGMVYKGVLVAALAVPFAFLWRWSYYFVSDEIGIGHLGGAGAWWDIYIPVLFYTMQWAGVFAYLYYRKQMAETRRVSRLSKAAVESQLSALKAQINPHFLYNTFNAISASVPPAQEQTRELLASLSDLFRYQVAASKTELMPLSRDLEFVQGYLALEAARMGHRLAYKLDIEADACKVLIPPLLLQPLVENAVRHGLSPKLEGGTIHLTATIEQDNLCLQVADDGVGIAQARQQLSAGTGTGLSNTRKRLLLRYGTHLHLEDRPEGGTLVRFSIPIQGQQSTTLMNTVRTSTSRQASLQA